MNLKDKNKNVYGNIVKLWNEIFAIDIYVCRTVEFFDKTEFRGMLDTKLEDFW